MAAELTVRRRQYHQEYYRRNKLTASTTKKRWWEAQRHPCPGVEGVPCGVLISRTAKRCNQHAKRDHSRKQKAARQAVKTSPPCPVCGVTMQPREWHGTMFVRCSGCGWETSPREIRRIHMENHLRIRIPEVAMFELDHGGSNVAA